MLILGKNMFRIYAIKKLSHAKREFNVMHVDLTSDKEIYDLLCLELRSRINCRKLILITSNYRFIQISKSALYNQSITVFPILL